MEGSGAIQAFTLHSIKTDYILVSEIKDFSEGMKVIENAFNDYNNIRPHSTLNYYSLNEFENKWNSDNNFRKDYEMYLNKLKESRRNRYSRNKQVMKSVS